MARIWGVSASIVLATFFFTGSTVAEDRIDCFEDCDTKMLACLDKPAQKREMKKIEEKQRQ